MRNHQILNKKYLDNYICTYLIIYHYPATNSDFANFSILLRGFTHVKITFSRKKYPFVTKKQLFLLQNKIFFAAKKLHFFWHKWNIFLWQREKDGLSFFCHKKYIICAKKLFFFCRKKNLFLQQKIVVFCHKIVFYAGGAERLVWKGGSLRPEPKASNNALD